jgi:hypothetical protein
LAYGHDLCYPPGVTKPKQDRPENWRLGRTDSDDEMDEEYKKYKSNLEKDDWSLEGEID